MRFFPKAQATRGFTLVELMVVLSIIAVLSAVVYANFNSARQSARDNIRKADLKDIQLALELYKAQNGHYPDGCKGNNAWSGGSNAPGVGFTCAAGVDYIVGLVPGYMPALPKDPSSATAGNNGYIYRSYGGAGSANEYKLMANGSVEKNEISEYTDEFARCPRVVGASCLSTMPVQVKKTYAVYKGTNAETW